MCCWQLRLVSTNKLIPGIDVFVHASLYTFSLLSYACELALFLSPHMLF